MPPCIERTDKDTSSAGIAVMSSVHSQKVRYQYDRARISRRYNGHGFYMSESMRVVDILLSHVLVGSDSRQM